MSKRRIRHKSLSSVLNRIDTTESIIAKPIFGASMTKSRLIPDSIMNYQMKNINLTDFKIARLFNKNISFFRDTFNQNDTSQLPFMSSLRKDSINQNYEYNKTTQLRPFSVSMKRTINQQFKKKIFDVNAKQSRVSKAYYRWHNKSGLNTTAIAEFEFSLREYDQNKNPEEINFSNIIKPIKYVDTEVKLYDQHQIICPKQKRSFRFKEPLK